MKFLAVLFMAGALFTMLKTPQNAFPTQGYTQMGNPKTRKGGNNRKQTQGRK